MAVIYHKIFEVDPKFIVDEKIKWVLTGMGEYVFAAYKGRRFFVKRDIQLCYPARDDSPAVKEKKLKTVKERERKQDKLQKLMKGLSYEKDCIAVEEYNFGDDDLRFTTVTALIPDILPDNHNYSSLDESQFKKLSLDVANILAVIHERGIIHGDLKEGNILVKRGAYTPYLIDFDKSFPASDVPEPYDDGADICGTPGYQSPEVLAYGKGGDFVTITKAADIFSFGVVLHRWWTSSFPSVDHEKKLCVGAAVFYDKKFTIDKKFDIKIGAKCEISYSELLSWMFAKDPAKRPTAKEVVAVLSDELDVPDEFLKDSNSDELWPMHALAVDLDKAAALKKKNVKSFKRKKDGSGGLKYLVKLKNGEESILTINEVCKKGYGKHKVGVICKPWDEHLIEFESVETIFEKGYAKIDRIEQARKKRYIITTFGGITFDQSHEWLISEGIAKPKKAIIDFGKPWPEDGAGFNAENCIKLKVNSIKPVKVYEKNVYEITFNDGTKPRTLPGKQLAFMGLLEK